MYYFKEEINGQNSWAKVFQSTKAFQDLAQAIFKKEGITLREEIQNLTPGTNAVFKADHYVIKIFAPEESGFGTKFDYNTELSVMEHIKGKGIAAPDLIAYGTMKDKYLFHYIIMEYIDAKEAGDSLASFHREQKIRIVKQLQTILKDLNQTADHLLIKKDLQKQAIDNPHLKGLTDTLKLDLADSVRNQEMDFCCLVHGDITGENVLITTEGRIILIDFADCTLAPAYYELGPIVFELFRGDREYVSEFMGDIKKEEFLEQLMKGLALHEYCGNLIIDYLTRLHIPYENVKSLEELKCIISQNIF